MAIPVFYFNNDKNHDDNVKIPPLNPILLKKCEDIIDRFDRIYGVEPDFISRSPGRVNLIGEHIDYVDFSVLPMAIDASMLIAFKILDKIDHDIENPSILLTNDNIKFAQRKFDLPLDGSSIPIDPSVSDWSNYFKCGLFVAHEYLKKKFPNKFLNKPLIGLKVLCKSDVPTDSGLASSTSFTCAVALGILRANMGPDFIIPKSDAVEICINAEHYVGVNNGGMDQVAAIYGEVQNALFVEFKPKLMAKPIEIPKSSGIRFLIANSLVRSNKYETAPTNYNLRVVEVTVAASVLARYYQIRLPTKKINNSTSTNNNFIIDDDNEGFDKGNLRDFMDCYYNKYYNDNEPWNGDSKSGIKKLNKMLELLEECFNENKIGFTVDQVSKALDCSKEEFTREYLTVFPIRFQLLKLYQRAKHVYSEALRVLKTLELIKEYNLIESKNINDYLKFRINFGKLMNESQESCSKLYECSTNELNDICSIAINNGSYGSRLTGAGWGGCTIHLLIDDVLDNVKNSLKEQYYKKRYPNITDEEIENAMIVSRPAQGSFLFEV